MAELVDDCILTCDNNSNLIEVTIVNETAFIWKADDVFRLRKNHRIIGNLVGCLTRSPFQNAMLGLPLQLCKEEVRLLMEKKFACANIIERSKLKNNLSMEAERTNMFTSLREKLFEEQKNLYKEKKSTQITSMADAIFEGKKKRYLEKLQGLKGKPKKRKKSELAVVDLSQDVEYPFDKESSIQEELDKIADAPKESFGVQLFTESPWSTKNIRDSTELDSPISDTDELRYQVFRDLWEKDLYVTSGSKFGGDFLAYPGDPLRYHAFYLVVCVAHSQKLASLDLVTLGRLSTQVKKTLVLATLKPDSTVDYISVKWSGHEPL